MGNNQESSFFLCILRAEVLHLFSVYYKLRIFLIQECHMSSDSILVISKCKIIVTLIIFSLIVVIVRKAIVRPFVNVG